MQREIKFRAFIEGISYWHYGSIIKYLDGTTYIVSQDKEDINVLLNMKCIPESVGQFTGLTDKNGVEIYEGDIIFDSHNKGSVYYNEDECQFLIDFKDENTTLLDIGFWGEIIGNIHQHAHLLE